MKIKRQKIYTFTESELNKHDHDICRQFGDRLIKDVVVTIQDDFDYDKERIVDFLLAITRVQEARKQGLIDDRKVESLIAEYSDLHF